MTWVAIGAATITTVGSIAGKAATAGSSTTMGGGSYQPPMLNQTLNAAITPPSPPVNQLRPPEQSFMPPQPPPTPAASTGVWSSPYAGMLQGLMGGAGNATMAPNPVYRPPPQSMIQLPGIGGP
jgi:hypothetical protein